MRSITLVPFALFLTFSLSEFTLAQGPGTAQPAQNNSGQSAWMLSPQSIEQSNRISEEINQEAERKKVEQDKARAEAQAKKAKEDEENQKMSRYQQQYIKTFKQEMARPSWNINGQGY